jgi:hypothetical protein
MQLKRLNRYCLPLSLFLILTISMSWQVPVVRCPPTVYIYLPRTVYSAGESVVVQITVDSAASSGRLIFGTPAGTINYDFGAISSGIPYTITVSGVTIMSGTYTVRAVVWIGGVAISSGTLGFSVGGGSGFGFDFALVLTPSSQTVEQGGTATFRILVTYSSTIYSGAISIDVTGLGAGMDWRSTTSGDLYISTSSSTPPGTYTIVVIGSSLGIIHQTSAVLMVNARAPPFDYAISISPATQTVSIGDKGSFMITVNLVSGVAAPTFLTLTGLPSGLGYSFSPQSGTPTFTSTLSIDASTVTVTGSYSFTVTAAAGGLSKTVTAGIVVKEAPDFTMSVSPDMATVQQGQKASLVIAVNPTAGGFDKIVSLSVAGLPSGTSFLFSVPSGRPPLISTLTITVSDSTPEGSYSVSIDAAGEAKIHSTRITLNVERKPTLLEQLFGKDVAPLVVPAAVLLVAAVAAAGVILYVVRRRRPSARPKT